MKKRDKFVNISILVLISCILIFVIDMYRHGVFKSEKSFEDYISGFGTMEVFMFMLIQIIQVMLPFMPTSVGSVAAIVLFGPIPGFLYNYVAICSGSIISFLLSKKYGMEFVMKIAGNVNIKKYLNLINDERRFKKIFSLAIFIPGIPDNYLCYIAGLTEMKFRYFISIILLGKPLSIAVFSFGALAALKFILAFFKR